MSHVKSSSNPPSDLPLVRPVANIERYFIAQGNTGVYHNVVIGTRLQLHVEHMQWPQNKDQWINLLSPALGWLVQERSPLSVVIANHLADHPIFLRLPYIDLNTIVRLDSVETPEDISTILEYEHAHPFNLTDHKVPLWRIIVVHCKQDDTFFLLYSFQHSISDGRSGMRFSELLVERLNHELHTPSAPLPNPAILPPSNEPLPPSLEERTDCNPSLLTILKEATMIVFLPGFLKRAIEPKYWAGDIHASSKDPHETLVDYIGLTQEETKQVVVASKANGITVNSVIYAASMFAIKAVFLSSSSSSSSSSSDKQTPQQQQKEVTTTKDKLNFATAVALRSLKGRPQIDPNAQGAYVSEAINTNIKVGLETLFWELGRTYGVSIAEKTQTAKGGSKLLEHMGLMKFLPAKAGEWEKFVLGQFTKLQHGRETTVRMSNLGRAWDQTSSTGATVVGFKVLHPVFSQSACTTSSAFTFSCATANNQLTMTNTWQKSTFTTREKVDVLLKEMKRIMLEASSKGKQYSFRDALL